MKRKFLSLFSLVLVFALLMGGIAYASPAPTEAYYTYTSAFINKFEIPLYTVNNYPYIIAEDLGYIFFDINWVDSEQTLYINYNPFDDINYGEISEPSMKNEKAADIYPSNLRVVLDGQPVTCYSIGGRALIPFDALGYLGEIVWLDGINTTYVTTPFFRETNPDWKTLMPGHCVYFHSLSRATAIEKAQNELWDDYNYALDGVPPWAAECDFTYSLHYNTYHSMVNLKKHIEQQVAKIEKQPAFYAQPEILNVLKEDIAFCNGYLQSFSYVNNNKLNVWNSSYIMYKESVDWYYVQGGKYLHQAQDALADATSKYLISTL